MTDIAKNAEPMEPDTVRREVSSDEAGAYTAQTTADALPYGTYDVRETATNGSYLLTDGEPRTFEVCAGRGLQEDRGRPPASWPRSPSRTRPPARRTCW